MFRSSTLGFDLRFRRKDRGENSRIRLVLAERERTFYLFRRTKVRTGKVKDMSSVLLESVCILSLTVRGSRSGRVTRIMSYWVGKRYRVFRDGGTEVHHSVWRLERDRGLEVPGLTTRSPASMGLSGRDS